MNTKKNRDSQLCAELSTKMIKNLGKEFLVKNTQFEELMKCIVSLYEVQRNTNLKNCKNIVDSFVNVMGKEEFTKKIEQSSKITKDTVKAIMGKNFGGIKKRGVSSSSHFHKEIRERKKSFLLSKCNNNGIKTSFLLTIKIVPKRKDSMNIVPKTLNLRDRNILKNN